MAQIVKERNFPIEKGDLVLESIRGGKNIPSLYK